jgi:hypothetical protein
MVSAISSDLISQDQLQDVVYLKNGGVVRGIVIEQVIGKSISIKTENDSVFVYASEEVEKIVKEKTQREISKVSAEQLKSSIYTHIARLGILTGEGTTFFTINIINGFHIGKYFELGFGIGYDKYPNMHVIPIFLDLRSYFHRGEISPLIHVDIGLSKGQYKFSDAWRFGGFMLNTGLGLGIQVSPQVTFLMEISYRLQVVQSMVIGPYYTEHGWETTYYAQGLVDYDFIMMTAGICF